MYIINTDDATLEITFKTRAWIDSYKQVDNRCYENCPYNYADSKRQGCKTSRTAHVCKHLIEQGDYEGWPDLLKIASLGINILNSEEAKDLFIKDNNKLESIYEKVGRNIVSFKHIGIFEQENDYGFIGKDEYEGVLTFINGHNNAMFKTIFRPVFKRKNRKDKEYKNDYAKEDDCYRVKAYCYMKASKDKGLGFKWLLTPHEVSNDKQLMQLAGLRNKLEFHTILFHKRMSENATRRYRQAASSTIQIAPSFLEAMKKHVFFTNYKLNWDIEFDGNPVLMEYLRKSVTEKQQEIKRQINIMMSSNTGKEIQRYAKEYYSDTEKELKEWIEAQKKLKASGMELAKRETIDYESWWFCNLAKTAELIENHLKLGISSNLDIWNYAQDLLLEIPQLKSWREFHDQIWPSSLNEE